MPETNVSHSYQASSLEEQQAAYDRWAKDYEADLCAMGYRIPAMIAAVFTRFVASGMAPILDAGCGGGIQSEDAAFISNYARDHPNREDHAETFPMWLAVMYRSDRISQVVQREIANTVPNRIDYYNNQGFDLYPVW